MNHTYATQRLGTYFQIVYFILLHIKNKILFDDKLTSIGYIVATKESPITVATKKLVNSRFNGHHTQTDFRLKYFIIMSSKSGCLNYGIVVVQKVCNFLCMKK